MLLMFQRRHMEDRRLAQCRCKTESRVTCFSRHWNQAELLWAFPNFGLFAHEAPTSNLTPEPRHHRPSSSPTKLAQRCLGHYSASLLLALSSVVAISVCNAPLLMGLPAL